VLDVLSRAEPRFDPDVKNDKLRHVVTVAGSDRYQAAIAWGEIDPDFEGRTVLVAVTEDGRPAADGRPASSCPATSTAAATSPTWSGSNSPGPDVDPPDPS